MKILVCGGRDFSNYAALAARLDKFRADNPQDPITLVIHGAARGADLLAKNWALDRHIPHQPFPAEWSNHGRAAGPIRNKKMLAEGAPDIVIAFPGSAGTADLIKQALAANIPVVEVP